MAGSEINRPFTYLPAEQGWVTIAISITHPVRESFVVLHSYVFQMFNRNQDAKIAKLISLRGVLCAFARDKQTSLCFSFLTIGNCFEFRPPAWLRAGISCFEFVIFYTWRLCARHVFSDFFFIQNSKYFWLDFG
jgi:hypothetical protein